jgi:hypothetical protein
MPAMGPPRLIVNVNVFTTTRTEGKVKPEQRLLKGAAEQYSTGQSQYVYLSVAFPALAAVPASPVASLYRLMLLSRVFVVEL